MFEGVVVKYAMHGALNQTQLEITLKDAAIKMTAQRKSRVFQAKTDKDIITQLITDSGLTADVVSTAVTHPELVQYACTDWDFLLMRAEANGLWVSVNEAVLSAFSASMEEAENSLYTLRLPRGVASEQANTYDISELSMEADLQQQYDTVSGKSWNSQEQKFAAIASIDAPSLPLENPIESGWSEALGTETCGLISAAELSEKEAETWANAQLTKTQLSMFRGWVRVGALPELIVGDVITLEGVGDLFDGEIRVSGIRHQADVSGWQTDIQLGLSSEWFWQKQPVSMPPAAGLVPAISGLQIGIVDAYEEDANNPYSVRVIVPALACDDKKISKAEGDVVWAQVAMLDAGPQRGTVFMPETGDQVILGFVQDDPRQAVILGAMHNPLNKPPWEPEEKNPKKGIVTKKNLQLLFDDTDDAAAITISTASGSQIVISDAKDKESISIVDKSANEILLNKEGITIKSVKNIVLDASEGDLTLKGKKVDVQ